MRLIDADAVIDRYNKEIPYALTIEEVVTKVPTAYDIDKVVEEITKIQKESYSYAFKYNDEFYVGQSGGLKKALDIINKHLKQE